MSKKAITILYCVSFGFLIAGGIPSTNGSALDQANAVLTYLEQMLPIIGLLLFFISLGGALYNSVKAGRWGWFVCLLFLNWAGLLAYLFAGPGLDAARTRRTVPRNAAPSMRKKTIAILYFIGLLLLVIGGIMFVVGIAPTSPTPITPNIGLLLGAMGVFIVGMIFFLISWVSALSNLARLERWDWFVWVLLLNLVAMIAYLFFNPIPVRNSGDNRSPSL